MGRHPMLMRRGVSYVEHKINIQRTRRVVYDSILRICYPTPDPLQDLVDRVRKSEEKSR